MKRVISYLAAAILASSAVVCGSLNAFAADHNQGLGTKIGSNQTVKTTTWTVANNLATNVATLTATSGVPIDRGGAVAVVVGAEATRTISGGNLRCYVFLPVYEPNLDAGTGVSYAWFPYSALDFAPATGNQYAASGDKQALTGIGRIVWIPDAITVSAGTTVTTTISVRYGIAM